MDSNNLENATKSPEPIKIAYVMDLVLLCGGVIVPFEHVRRLRDRGYDAFIVANNGNLSEYRVPVYPISKLEEFTDRDVIVSVWYPQVTMLEKFKGRKIQFSQDCIEDIPGLGQAVEDCRVARRNQNWEIMAVSRYAGDWLGRDYFLMPNGVNERFFLHKGVERDIDVLIEGHDEENKGIKDAFEIAESIPGLKIGWLAREGQREGIENFTNPPREIIPEIYQRAKVVIKCSKSEGFGLPHLEAMASGCVLLTYDSGGNDFCTGGWNCFESDSKEYLKGKLREIANGLDVSEIIKNAKKTAQEYKWDINKLEQFLTKKIWLDQTS